jgi:alpha-beta hydrolase superfamily lysophospholipase
MGVVKSEHASAPVFVLASSWAAKLGILLAAAPTSLTGLMLTGPGLFPRVGFTRPQTLRILAQHFVDPTARFQIPLRAEQYTNDQDRVALIKADPLRLLTATAQFFWETARLDRLRHDASARIAIPLLVLQGQSDAMMDVPKTARWFAALGVADRTYRGYPGAAHTLDFEHDRATYQRDILEWLSERSQTPGRGATCLP